MGAALTAFEPWREFLAFVALYTSTVVGVVMYVNGIRERVKVVETTQATRDTTEGTRYEGLKTHVDDKFNGMDKRFDRLETKMDGLFVPRGVDGGKHAR